MNTTIEPRPRPKPSASRDDPAVPEPDGTALLGVLEAWLVGVVVRLVREAELLEVEADDDAVVELVTDVEVVVGILPKMEDTMAEILDSAAACTPLHRSRSELLSDCLFNTGQQPQCPALVLES